MPIEAGSEIDLLPLLVEETVVKVLVLNSGNTNSGSRVSILSIDVSLKRSWVFDRSSRSWRGTGRTKGEYLVATWAKILGGGGGT